MVYQRNGQCHVIETVEEIYALPDAKQVRYFSIGNY